MDHSHIAVTLSVLSLLLFPLFGMPFTTAAWQQSVDPAGAFLAIGAVPDQHITVLANDIRVPSLNQIIALAAGVETTVAQQARLTAPSRRVLALQRVAPTQGAAAGASVPGDPHRVLDLRTSPLVMVQGENAEFEINSNPAAPQIQWGVVWFASGPPAEVDGNIFTIRADSATALVAGAWTNVPIVLAENLPRGRYQVVGLRAQSAGLVAARMVFVGTGATGWRPGVLGTNNDRHLEHPMFRLGNLGVFGEFEDIDLPTIDCLAVSADATQQFYLDLIQTRSGPG